MPQSPPTESLGGRDSAGKEGHFVIGYVIMPDQ